MTPRARRVAAGRAGRLRLRRSLATALRGADLLERKLRLLLDREHTARRAAEDARRVWEERLADAETWLLRGVLLGGERALVEHRCSAPVTSPYNSPVNTAHRVAATRGISGAG
ncbi:V-type ATP synthase subunit D, partial [Streptomyces sp. NPDC003233]